MKLAVGNATPRRLNQPSQYPRIEIPLRSVFGFPVSENQFQFLQESTIAVSQSSVQIEDRLIDPRSTRLSRLQAARRFEDQETLENVSSEGILYTVELVNDEQGILHSGGVGQLVSSGIHRSFFPHSLFVSPSDILNV